MRFNNIEVYAPKKDNCKVIIDDFGNVFGDVGDCLTTVFDENKKTSGLFGNLFSLTKSVSRLTFDVGSCVVKNTPKAINAIKHEVEKINEETNRRKLL